MRCWTGPRSRSQIRGSTSPKPIRPGIVSNLVIGFAALFYLGMLFYSVVVYGVAFALDSPTRQAFIPELVPAHDLPNAIGLNSASTQVARVHASSGTTGRPKGVVRDNGGHAVALLWSMRHIYDVGPGDVFWAASDVGWVVGHSYIVYAPLLHGATSILYEGKPVGTPDAGAFWRIIAEHKVAALFTAPTAFRAIKKEDPDGKFIRQYDLSKFRTLFLAGERADPPTVEWAEQQLKVPVIDHWWQTETGWAICGNFQGLDPMPVKLGSTSVPSTWRRGWLSGRRRTRTAPGSRRSSRWPSSARPR